MEFIFVPALFGIVAYGVYSVFELFVRRRERLEIIDKLGDKLTSEVQGRGVNFARNSYTALKGSCLLIGLGVGLLIGFILESNFHVSNRETRGVVYGAPVLICGGLGLLAAFLIEYRLSRKNGK